MSEEHVKAGKKLVEFGNGFLAKSFSDSGIRNGRVSNILVYSDTDANFWTMYLLSKDVIYYGSYYHKDKTYFLILTLSHVFSLQNSCFPRQGQSYLNVLFIYACWHTWAGTCLLPKIIVKCEAIRYNLGDQSNVEAQIYASIIH